MDGEEKDGELCRAGQEARAPGGYGGEEGCQGEGGGRAQASAREGGDMEAHQRSDSAVVSSSRAGPARGGARGVLRRGDGAAGVPSLLPHTDEPLSSALRRGRGAGRRVRGGRGGARPASSSGGGPGRAGGKRKHSPSQRRLSLGSDGAPALSDAPHSNLPSGSMEVQSDDDDYEGAVKPAGPGKFRLQGKKFSITYPQCEIGRAEFHAAFQAAFHPDSLRTAREQHKGPDGLPGPDHHLHVFAEWNTKRNIKSARHFDLSFVVRTGAAGDDVPAAAAASAVEVQSQVYHPNIKKCWDVAGWLRYISKDGDYEDSLGSFQILEHPIGKRQAIFNDHRFTQEFLRAEQDKHIQWPVVLNCADGVSYTMDAPSAALKKRHWWIVSPPNSGKTYWINETFAGKKVFCPMKGEYPFEAYKGEELIIYDDRDNISFEEFSNVANVYKVDTHVYGKARFVRVTWPRAPPVGPPPRGAVRNIIVLSNLTIEQQCPNDVDRMKARFKQIINAKLAPDHFISHDDPEDVIAVSDPAEFGDFAS